MITKGVGLRDLVTPIPKYGLYKYHVINRVRMLWVAKTLSYSGGLGVLGIAPCNCSPQKDVMIALLAVDVKIWWQKSL